MSWPLLCTARRFRNEVDNQAPPAPGPGFILGVSMAEPATLDGANAAKLGADAEALAINHAVPVSNAPAVVSNAELLAPSHALMAGNARVLRRIAETMQANRDLALAIAAKLGVAA